MKNSNLSFYEIYPTSFYDSNGDGIGDIKGIIKKLDYVKSLGFKGIWFNPFFLSPFLDGGYDIVDYKKIDPRFGTNNDAYKLIKECHKRDLLVLFDLVAGHMSWLSKDFIESSKANPKESVKDRFVWTDSPWAWESDYAIVRGIYDRNGAYMVNFFAHQPALNYGFRTKTRSWQQSENDEGPRNTRKFIVDVMKFWCSKGVDGFRCDMADSLVKNDNENKDSTQAAWNEMFGEVRKEYPNMISVSEWCNPIQALNASFDMDFVLDHSDNFSYYFFRYGREDWEDEEKRKKAPLLVKFDQELYDYAVKDMVNRIKVQESIPDRFLSIISGNHDTFRIADGLKGDALKDAFILIFTLPGIPFVFAGDELSQRTKRGYPSKDGGFQRTGTRFAMKWNNKEINYGFSSAHKNELYLPVCEDSDNVKDAVKDKTSLLNLIVELNKIRDRNSDLTSHEGFTLLDETIAYRRGKILVAINLKDEDMVLNLKEGTSLLTVGKIRVKDDSIILKHNAAIIYKED